MHFLRSFFFVEYILSSFWDCTKNNNNNRFKDFTCYMYTRDIKRSIEECGVLEIEELRGGTAFAMVYHQLLL